MKSQNKGKYVAWSAVALAAFVLAACGGGSDDAPPSVAPDPTVSVPANANDSIDVFIGYLQRLVMLTPDGVEPVDTSSVVPPTDDKAEPVPVN
ncbi:hypothetical protein J2X20_005896 [Pelomonas saccharophila]|uniref:Lipoprotein n=1 Tax=Roseateles saccharophilus TaxID=304 RepID=A0ABU1YYW1_ROSSA|nr:hypothetical protein [Roseateles saccharophilus]MDR7273206.1 hypothetical protein [Roseateles saccharophilus]